MTQMMDIRIGEHQTGKEDTTMSILRKSEKCCQSLRKGGILRDRVCNRACHLTVSSAEHKCIVNCNKSSDMITAVQQGKAGTDQLVVQANT